MFCFGAKGKWRNGTIMLSINFTDSQLIDTTCFYFGFIMQRTFFKLCQRLGLQPWIGPVLTRRAIVGRKKDNTLLLSIAYTVLQGFDGQRHLDAFVFMQASCCDAHSLNIWQWLVLNFWTGWGRQTYGKLFNNNTIRLINYKIISFRKGFIAKGTLTFVY